MRDIDEADDGFAEEEAALDTLTDMHVHGVSLKVALALNARAYSLSVQAVTHATADMMRAERAGLLTLDAMLAMPTIPD